MRNYEYLLEITAFFSENKLDYNLNDIFEDYGLKKLVKKLRNKVKELGIERNRSNSIIKEPFESFPENKRIMQLTKLVSFLLKKIERE